MKCPAFEKKEKIFIRRKNEIKKKNTNFFKSLLRTKSTYDNQKYRNDYLFSKYLSLRMSENSLIYNPNLIYLRLQDLFYF